MAVIRPTKLLLAFIVITNLILISWGIIYRTTLENDYGLYTDFQLNNPGVLLGGVFTFDPPSFQTSEDVLIDAIASGSVATGRIKERTMRDRQTREMLGTATLVEVVTPNPRNPVQILRTYFVVQFALSSESNRNVMPWVLKAAVDLAKVPITVGEEILPKDQIERIFPRGSGWNFIPLLDMDINRSVLSQLVEYTAYAERYYGGEVYEVPGFLTRILGRSWFPIVLDVTPLQELPIP